MLKCPSCGGLNDDTSRFCVLCGTRLPQQVAGEPSSKAPTTDAPPGPTRSKGQPAAGRKPGTATPRSAGRGAPGKQTSVGFPSAAPTPVVPPPPAPSVGVTSSPGAPGQQNSAALAPAPAPPATPVAAGGTGATAPKPAKERSGVGSSPLPFGDLLDDIDTGFERIVDRPGPSSEPTNARDLAEVKELFSKIATTHMGPVRDFVLELKLGEPPREWLDLVLPAVATLRKSADGMGLAELCVSLDAFLDTLEVTATRNAPYVTGETRDRVLSTYEQLGKAMPEAFALDQERDRREPIILQSLLRQVPDVRKVALDKLYGAGLTSLGMYYVAKPADIAEASGVSVTLATRILERIAQYKREIAHAVPDAGRSKEYQRLDQLSRQLREQNAAFDVAARSWSKGASRDKRRLRKERNETVLQINVLLARLGAVDLVGQLERLPFHSKIDALDEYLQDAKGASGYRALAPAGNR